MDRLPYSYRVMLTHEDCLAKRAVTFRDGRFLNWLQVCKEALKYFTSQNCAHCGRKHDDSEYVVTDAEMGEPDKVGFYRYRFVLPERADLNQLELPYDDNCVGR